MSKPVSSGARASDSASDEDDAGAEGEEEAGEEEDAAGDEEEAPRHDQEAASRLPVVEAPPVKAPPAKPPQAQPRPPKLPPPRPAVPSQAAEPLKAITGLVRVAAYLGLSEYKATFDKMPEVQPRVKISAFEYAAGLECFRVPKSPHIGVRPLTECAEIIDVKSFAVKAVHSAAPEPEGRAGRDIAYFNGFCGVPLHSVAALAGPPTPGMSHPKDRRKAIQSPQFDFLGAASVYEWFGVEADGEGEGAGEEEGEKEEIDHAGEEEDDDA
jgi:hypothetical protein